MGTEHLTAATSLCDLFHEFELCPDEILTILQSLDENNNNNIFRVVAAVSASATPLCSPKDNQTSTKNNKNRKRKKPAKTASSSSPGCGSDEESDDHAVLSQRKSIKRQNESPRATSMDDASGEDGGGARGSNNDGKVVSHIAVERNRRKQMNEHLAVLRQLMPCFYVKKGDQASIIGGVIDYINELQQVLQSLEAKKQRKIYTTEVGLSPRVASSPRLIPPQHSNSLPRSPKKLPPLSPRPLINLPISPRTPQSTSPYKSLIRQPIIHPASITSPTSVSNSSCSSIPDMTMMSGHNSFNFNNGAANELVASSKSSIADVEVKFCGPNLELRTLSSKMAGQTTKIVSAIEDLALEILQVSINTIDEAMLNSFIIKIGIDCQLSAEELAQQIQQTFCC